MQQINKPYEGLFITIEGGEGSGKTTLAAALAKEMEKRGYSVVRTREPGGAPLSEHLRSLLLEPPKGVTICEKAELLLFLAARAQHLEEQILPALRSGKVVICERFNDSTIAYQGYARHLGKQQVEQMCTLATSGIVPDCTLFLDVDPELGLKRVRGEKGGAFDRLEQEHLQFHREVRQGFLHLADQHPDRFEVIDACETPECVLKKALEAALPHLVLKP